jgi:hypothetical protein
MRTVDGAAISETKLLFANCSQLNCCELRLYAPARLAEVLACL